MTPRRFNLIDAMILVFALSMAFAWTRAVVPKVVFSEGPGAAVFRLVRVSAPGAVPFLVLGSLALIAVRLRNPRPVLRELAAEPGFIACLIPAIVVALHIALACVGSNLAHLNGWRGGLLNGLDYYAYVLYYLPETGLAVAGSWLALGAVGCWRAASNWLERACRVMGFSWMVLFAVVRIAEYCRYPINLGGREPALQ
jgi:hypothetical protein